ncbi:MAG: DUF1786 domain-containing protein [Dehalococcoidia bacterium]
MKILAVDVGTGTQDILLFDTAASPENCVKLVMPSATSIAAARIREATRRREPAIISGQLQGGGPCHWALEDHLRAGLPAYATAEAALTFDDELDRVTEMGVVIVGEDEVRDLRGAHVELRDLDLGAIGTALRAFGIDAAYDGFAVGCLDHGNSPPGYSDRLFRFDHLRSVVERGLDLRTFAYLPEELPDYLTRARALAASIPAGVPAVVLDTGPAAALGALQDPEVARHNETMVLNLGNMHALAFHLQSLEIISLYEHHTGEMTNDQIEDFTLRLVDASLRQDEVYNTQGHGVFYATPRRRNYGVPFLAVTGPQRGRLRSTRLLHPYFAAPHGDMMLSGCFGMLSAFAYRQPDNREEIERALAR